MRRLPAAFAAAALLCAAVAAFAQAPQGDVSAPAATQSPLSAAPSTPAASEAQPPAPNAAPGATAAPPPAGEPAKADPSDPVPVPILEPSQRWAFDGFSILPPQEPHWFSLAKTRSRAVLAKPGLRGDSGAIVSVVAERVDVPMPTPEAFLEAMQVRRDRDLDPDRIASIAREEKLESTEGVWCTAYRLRANEVVAWYAQSRVTDVIGRACLHPQIAGLVIDIAYAVRLPFTEENGVTAQQAYRFVGGLELLPAPVTAPDAAALAAAAVAGDPVAAYRLGAMYERGRGVAADPAQAEQWYLRAARGGEADAMFNLGALFERGPRREPKEAFEWFLRASDQRDAQAQLNLGLMFYKGEGVPRDAAKSRDFLSLSALNGNERAKELVERLKFDE
jgi:Sel1 repeat